MSLIPVGIVTILLIRGFVTFGNDGKIVLTDTLATIRTGEEIPVIGQNLSFAIFGVTVTVHPSHFNPHTRHNRHLDQSVTVTNGTSENIGNRVHHRFNPMERWNRENRQPTHCRYNLPDPIYRAI
jgi:hypothetical protein